MATCLVVVPGVNGATSLECCLVLAIVVVRKALVGVVVYTLAVCAANSIKVTESTCECGHHMAGSDGGGDKSAGEIGPEIDLSTAASGLEGKGSS